MSKTTAFLVDDMPAALQLLRTDLVKEHPEITIIGEAKSVVEAAKILQKKQPDLLFLDILLGDGTGFDLLEIFPNLQSKIIFITASDEFAVKAFKFSAIDYILKPYSLPELAEAIAKARQQIQPKKEQLAILKQSIARPNSLPKKISLHTLEKIIVVAVNSIVRCESDSNYTTFFFEDNSKILVTKTLKYFADLLAGNQFLRVHQSHLVNTQYIKEFIKTDGGYLVLKNKQSIPVSVRKRNEVIAALTDL